MNNPNCSIDDILDAIDAETRDIPHPATGCSTSASGAYWDSFDCQIQCEEYYRVTGYGEGTYNAIQEYLSEQSALC